MAWTADEKFNHRMRGKLFPLPRILSEIIQTYAYTGVFLPACTVSTFKGVAYFLHARLRWQAEDSVYTSLCTPRQTRVIVLIEGIMHRGGRAGRLYTVISGHHRLADVATDIFIDSLRFPNRNPRKTTNFNICPSYEALEGNEISRRLKKMFRR